MSGVGVGGPHSVSNPCSSYEVSETNYGRHVHAQLRRTNFWGWGRGGSYSIGDPAMAQGERGLRTKPGFLEPCRADKNHGSNMHGGS